MEERIIDDEYGRGVKLRKTKDGYVDVTDELAEDTQEYSEEEVDEIAFEFPVTDLDEDDEDLVGLSPEEAAALRKKKAEEEAKRKAEYERTCAEGDELLETGSYKSAELKFERALLLDVEATDASVGYWRAKTADFTQPDVLMDEYVEAGVENMEYDLGYKAVEKIAEKYQHVFKARLDELNAEEEPLVKEVEEKQTRRREILKGRLKRSGLVFGIVALITLTLAVLTAIFGSQILSTKENVHLVPTVVLGAAAFISLLVSVFTTNRFLNDLRMRAANERLSSTEEGERLIEIRAYKELYEYFVRSTAEKE